LDEGPLAPPAIPAQPTDHDWQRRCSSQKATNADGVWRLVVRSSDDVVGHIFRIAGEYGYFSIDASTVTFRDPDLERLKKRIVAGRR
jgi:hypothetical protein